MKVIKGMENAELEKVVGGSLKNAYPRLLGPDGMQGSAGGSAPISHTYYHPAY